MDNSVRSKAEERFNKLKIQDMKALKEKEKAQLEGDAKVARLRALRMAKEAGDKEAADRAAAEKAAAKREASPKKRRAAAAVAAAESESL